MKIAVAGLGYVGLSNALLFSEYNDVCAFDINPEKVDMINNGVSPIKDSLAEEYIKKFRICAMLDGEKACIGADFVIIATPTDYNPSTKSFDTSGIDKVIELVTAVNRDAVIVIKSTIPIGYTDNVINRSGCKRIIFSPEFLREGKALYDSLYPSRIVVGSNEEMKLFAEKFAHIACSCTKKKNVPVVFTTPAEAEAIKLFSNTYLAMRVAYFNELDAFAESMKLNAKSIIDGVCLDRRIGNHYNNPSFGYGGYCLPKDTKQLLENFGGIPHKIISAIVKSNEERMDYIADRLRSENPGIVGIYRLNMKYDSDNFRSSAILGVIKRLNEKKISVLIYEPLLKEKKFMNCTVTDNLMYFKAVCDIIVTNRFSNELKDVLDKVYTRDLYMRD